MLEPGFHDVPPGMVAMVVTHLEMRAPPPAHTVPDQPDLSLRPVQGADPAWYRTLFRTVGQDWLWFGRLGLSDEDLTAILRDPAYEVFAVTRDGADLGLLELDFRQSDQCELAYFGLGQDLIGRGAGRWLMTQALSRAWVRPISRLTVHTCTLDSPQALAFYIRSGFSPVRQEIEIASDPRLAGLLPCTAAPQVPIIEDTP